MGISLGENNQLSRYWTFIRVSGNFDRKLAANRTDEWSPALLVASRGPERSGHRYFGATETGPLAALRFFRKLLHTARRAPRVIITDKLGSYAAAKRMILPNIEHRQSRYLNNRAENSHQPTRVQERQMKRFQSPE
jgi:DDE domain